MSAADLPAGLPGPSQGEEAPAAAHPPRAAPASLEELSRTAVDLAERLEGPLQSLRVRSGDAAVELEWARARPPAEAAAPPVAAAAAAQPQGEDGSAGHGNAPDPVYVCSPMVGTFYHAPEPGAQPFVAVGDTVEPGQQIGIIEAMKLMNRIDAERAGRVVDVLVPNGAPVEYGEQLIACAPLED